MDCGIKDIAEIVSAIKRRGLIPRLSFYAGGLFLGDISVFIDESGTQEGKSTYYVVTYVLHNQADSIGESIERYERSLKNREIPNIPFHATPLLRAHDSYANLSLHERKSLLVSFNVLVQRLPIRYRSFVYRSREFGTPERLQALIRRDLVSLLVDHLDYFQAFGSVKIYYDQGQPAVSNALREAFSFALSKQATVSRSSDYRRFRLAQVADYLCAIELAAVKYKHHEETETDEKFFGGYGAFKKNWLKQARRKRFE